MSIEQMRAAVKKAYPSDSWPKKVDQMKDAQVAAIYQRLLDKKYV